MVRKLFLKKFFLFDINDKLDLFLNKKGIFSNKLYQFLPCLQKREDKKKKEVVFKRKAGSVMSRAV